MAASIIKKSGISESSLCKKSFTSANTYESITLSDSIDNYDFIGIHLLNYDNIQASTMISVADLKASNSGATIRVTRVDGDHGIIYYSEPTKIYGQVSVTANHYIRIKGYKIV